MVTAGQPPATKFNDMIVISKEIDTFLLKDGYLKEDLKYIKECSQKCNFQIARLPKGIAQMTTQDYDNLMYRNCSKQVALNKLGWQSFWLGIGRTSGHCSTIRENNGYSVRFEWDFWK